MAIHIITGRPGSGKTYYLALKAKKFLEQGLDVYSNFGLNWNGPNIHYYKEFDELIAVKNGVILMDEAQIYLNCRFWDKLDPSFQYKLQQHRKHGLDIWGTVQSVNRLDVIFRELVSNYYEVKKVGTGEKKGGGLPKHPFGFFILREYDIKEANKIKRKPFLITLLLMRKKILGFYDTFKDLGFRSVDQVDDIISVKMYICPTCGAQKVLDRPKYQKTPLRGVK